MYMYISHYFSLSRHFILQKSSSPRSYLHGHGFNRNKLFMKFSIWAFTFKVLFLKKCWCQLTRKQGSTVIISPDEVISHGLGNQFLGMKSSHMALAINFLGPGQIYVTKIHWIKAVLLTRLVRNQWFCGALASATSLFCFLAVWLS